MKILELILKTKQQLKKELDKKFGINSCAIYNPLNIRHIKSKSKEKIHLKFFKGNYLKIITIGRLVDQKDHFTMLKSINLLNKKNAINQPNKASIGK